jgi:hypothetical protein
VFENIKSIRPYFFSLREIEGNVSLDIKLPINWKYETIVSPYKSIKIKIQDKSEKHTLMSLISTATQEGYDVVFACASEILKINQEEEEKQKLFQQKVKELQDLFMKESLDKLKDINLTTYGQEITPSVRLVEEGDGEGFFRDGEPQEKDDRRNQEN